MTRPHRPVSYPTGTYPRRMPEELAAGYVGERTIEGFLKRIGKEYPHPRVKQGRRQLWLIDDLDKAISQSSVATADLAEEL